MPWKKPKNDNVATFEKIVGDLVPFDSIFSALRENAWPDLKGFAADCRRATEIVSDTHRKLKLGIIGQVKAGKSSFLNELLFDGEDILPQAATPMTAALTVISHGEGFAAELTYYDRDDWKRIVDGHATAANQLRTKRDEYQKRRNDSPAKIKAALPDIGKENLDQLFVRFGPELDLVGKTSYELVKAAETVADLEAVLGQIQLNHYSSLAELKEAMPSFVGVNGKYTPLVKSCRLVLQLPSLEQINLVDTPGMNDPIISRGQKTREYLKECDAVFLLSPAGQFLDMTDLDLLRCYLPSEGISSISLVASKFDSALKSEAGKHAGDLGKTRTELQKTLAAETDRKIGEALKKAPPESILHRLRNIKPLLTSSYLAGFARKLQAGKREEVEATHTFKMLARSFPSTSFDEKLLLGISGMPGAHEQLGQVKADKERIFAARLADLDQEKTRRFKELLISLQESVTRQEKLLSEGDIDDLERQMKKLADGIKACRNKIGLVFDDELTKIHARVNHLVDMIEDGQTKAREISVETRHETETYQVEKSGFWAGCWRTIGTGGYETRTRNTTTKVADTYEAIGRMETLGRQARQAVREEMENIFGENFKSQLRVALVSVIEKHIATGADFDKDSVLIPLRKAINRLAVTRFEFDESVFVKIISGKFSGEVTDSKVEALREAQREAVAAMVKAIVDKINKHTEKLIQDLRNSGDSFADELIKNVQEGHDILANQLKDRKGNLERYQGASAVIAESLSLTRPEAL